MDEVPLSLQLLSSHPPPSCGTLSREESPGIPSAGRGVYESARGPRRRAPVPLRGRSPGSAVPDARTCRGRPAPCRAARRHLSNCGGGGASERAAGAVVPVPARLPRLLSPAEQGKGEQAASSRGAGPWNRGARAAPAAGPQGVREGRTGWGARPRGPNLARCSRPPGRPRAPGPRRRAPVRAGTSRRAGSEGRSASPDSSGPDPSSVAAPPSAAEDSRGDVSRGRGRRERALG